MRDAVLDLQRTAGNRAVASVFAAPVVQRKELPTTGEGHDLTSPILRDDDVLQQTKEGLRAVKPGANGEHVRRIQNALTAVGHTPAGGADAAYGGGTTRAVRDFQTAVGMGPVDRDGVVGKRTITSLDNAVNQGGAAPDPDAESEDTVIRDKHPGDEPNRVFFTLGSADLDDEERTKITAFATAHPTTPLFLTGLASEEGPEALNRDLAQQRVDAVDAALSVQHHAPRTPEARPEQARGSSRYRFMRAVKIETSAPTAPPSCAPGVQTRVTCDGARSAEVARTRGVAGDAIATARAALVNPDRSDPIAQRADALLDQIYGTTDADRATTRTAVAGQANLVEGVTRDASRFDCATACDPGTLSGFTAVESGGRITLFDKFFDPAKTPGGVRGALIAHEAHHAALPGDDADNGQVESTDLAYNYRRLFGHLRPEQALRNASSFHGLVVHTAQPAGMPLDAAQTRITPEQQDDMSSLPQSARPAFQKALGWMEQWVGTADFTVAGIYKRASEAHDQRRWEQGTEGTQWFVGNFMRPRFGLQAPYRSPPTEQDLRTIAAINDRIDLMERAFSQNLTVRHAPQARATSWERGPGATITVPDAVIAADDNQRTSMLTDALVAATPGISARWQVEYSALIREIRAQRDRLGPES